LNRRVLLVAPLVAIVLIALAAGYLFLRPGSAGISSTLASPEMLLVDTGIGLVTSPQASLGSNTSYTHVEVFASSAATSNATGDLVLWVSFQNAIEVPRVVDVSVSGLTLCYPNPAVAQELSSPDCSASPVVCETGSGVPSYFDCDAGTPVQSFQFALNQPLTKQSYLVTLDFQLAGGTTVVSIDVPATSV
jgi:hypothetical protein